MASTTIIRRAVPADVPALVGLAHELAAYERAPDECLLTPDHLTAALFAEPPAVFAHVAEVDGVVVGSAVWFLTFSTWRGVHGIHLEDLFVQPAHRGSGLGKALLAELARECVRNGYERLEWAVLDWNQPAIDFYNSLKAEPQSDWFTYRLTTAPLQALAATPTH